MSSALYSSSGSANFKRTNHIKHSFLNSVIKGVCSSFGYCSFHCAILEKDIPEDMNYCKNLSSVKKVQHQNIDKTETQKGTLQRRFVFLVSYDSVFSQGNKSTEEPLMRITHFLNWVINLLTDLNTMFRNFLEPGPGRKHVENVVKYN